MNTVDLRRLNCGISAELRRRRAAGAEGTDDEIADAILISYGLGPVKIGRQLTRLRRFLDAAPAGLAKRPASSS